MQEFPKMLYRSGWADLADAVLVESAAEEAHAREHGFRMLSEGDAMPESAEAAQAPVKPRRGRKPKAP